VGGERLQAALDGYAKFLCEKDLALPKHQPHLVRWVREFLLFAQEHLSACNAQAGGGYTFEQALDLFLAEVGGRVGVKPWQIQQAADAVRIYRHQCRCAAAGGDGPGAGRLMKKGPPMTRACSQACGRSSGSGTTPGARRGPTCAGRGGSWDWRIASGYRADFAVLDEDLLPRMDLLGKA